MPIIALLTDFGLRDHYAAAMKGVILGIQPDVTLVDITHDIPPQDVPSAALELAACRRDFPPGSIFLVVVDPGVGTSRRALAAKVGDRFFVAPDNGVLDVVFQSEPPSVVVELTERKYQRETISHTFEGRDRFAPVAAWLARGTDIRAFGAAVSDWVRLNLPRAHVSAGAITGEIVKIDRFGNLISNIHGSALDALGTAGARFVHIAGSGALPFVQTYGEVAPGCLCALVGSSGYVEVAANGDSAARLLGAGRGARVSIAADRSAPRDAGRQ